MEWSDGGTGEVNTVSTTGIYCRAGCAGRPRPENTARMSCPAAAEAAGFRPCLRCRPDHLPIVPIRPDSDPVIAAALVHIADGFLDRSSEADLGRAVGVSARHLRRLFATAIGATPSQVARSRRAHFARLLLDDTDLTVTEIAFAAGFGSVRTMNGVVHEIFRCSPNELRRKRRRSTASAADGGLVLRLRTPRAAAFDRHLAALATNAVTGVESVDGRTYRRTTDVCGHPGVVEIAAVDDGTIRIVAHLPAVAGLIDEVARCRRLLGLDEASAALVGTWTEFEGAIRGLVAAVEPDRAGDVLADLADRYGTPIRGVAELGLTRLFPVAAQLCSVADLPVGDGRLASRIRELATAGCRS